MVQDKQEMWHTAKKSKYKLISDDVLLWISTYRWTNVSWSTKTYIYQFCADTGYSLENLSGVMDDADGWQEKIREFWTVSMTWWRQ